MYCPSPYHICPPLVPPARHVGDRMYRGQTFVMQMDAHCQFVNSWDTQIISQWTQTQNEMAVLRYNTAKYLLNDT